MTQRSELFSVSRDLQIVQRRINAALDRYSDIGPGCPPHLKNAIRHSLLAPGKRFRPALVLLASEACGGTWEAATPAACAVEMIHTYSLIHDDLPAMDDDDLRRGIPTCHKKYGEATAILAGDALQALAFEILSRDIRPGETAVACCATLAEAAGPCHLVGGQADDTLGSDARGGLEALESIHRRKTGSLISASLRLGGLVAGTDPKRLDALTTYGHCLGLAFQITDDLLDARGDEATVGKRVGKDLDRGKHTFPRLSGIDASQRRAEQLAADACAALGPLESGAQKLEALARYVLERNR